MFRSPSLTGRFFQLGYIARDMDAAIRLLGDRYGLKKMLKFTTADLGAKVAPGDELNVALGYLGDIQYEIIQPLDHNPVHYRDALRADGGLSLHHLGFVVTQDRFATLANDLTNQGIDVVVNHRYPIGVSVIYGDTRADVGHYSEFIALEPGGEEFFRQVPRNDT